MLYGDDIDSNFTVSANIETTVACSYDTSSKTGYFFLKDPVTGKWMIESHVFNNNANTTLGEGFAIGGFPHSSSGLSWYPFYGTIGLVRAYSHACTTIQNIEKLSGTWDYTWVSNVDGCYRQCERIGRYGGFFMNGCNFVNLRDDTDYSSSNKNDNMFYRSFGYEITSTDDGGGGTYDLFASQSYITVPYSNNDNVIHIQEHITSSDTEMTIAWVNYKQTRTNGWKGYVQIGRGTHECIQIINTQSQAHKGKVLIHNGGNWVDIFEGGIATTWYEISHIFGYLPNGDSVSTAPVSEGEQFLYFPITMVRPN